MPRMQVYLPEELYRQVKERELPVSELLQTAVREELRLRALRERADEYLRDLVAEVGEPSPHELTEAEAIAGRIRRHAIEQAG